MASVPEARMHAREAENRAIATAFLASVALHLLLLVAWPMLRDPAKRAEFSPGPIIARLIAPEPTAPVDVAAPQGGAPSTPKPVATPASKPEKSPIEIAEPARTLRPTPTAPAEPELSPSEKLELPLAPERENPERRAMPEKAAVSPPRFLPPAFAPEPAAAPADTAPAPSESVPRAALTPSARGPMPKRLATASAPGAPDAGTLAQYRLAVIEAAKRYKRYPRVALDNNWEGRVEVRMVIGVSGAIASLDVHASTGHEVLDREALDLIRQAKSQTSIPASLRGRDFAIEIPVIFSLREPGA